MKVSEIIKQAEILKQDIEGCKHLIEFYKNKQENLQKEYKNLLNSESEIK